MKRLTDREGLFAQHFALTGRKERSAIAAGTNPASARTRAYRWLQKAEVQARIEEIREEHFGELRARLIRELHRSVMRGLQTGLRVPEARRAIALMTRLQIFQFTKAVRELLAGSLGQGQK